MPDDPNSNAIAVAVRRRIVETASNKDAAVADLGCGDGRILADLRADGFSQLTGIGWEFSTPEGAGRYEHLDLSAVGWADQLDGHRFDCVISTEVLEHLVNPYQFLTETRRLIADGGVLLLTFPNVHNWRSIVGYAVSGRFSGFFGPNWNDNHPLYDQHIFIPNMHLVRYFLELAGFTVASVTYLNGRGRLGAQTTMVECRPAPK